MKLNRWEFVGCVAVSLSIWASIIYWAISTAGAATTAQFSGQAGFNGYYSENEIDITARANYSRGCDVTFTENNATWSESLIEAELNGEDGDKVFCFNPGDYTDHNEYDITKSGNSTSDRRWIRLTGTSMVHPIDLSGGQRATIKGIALKAQNWVIHRMAYDGTGGGSHENIELEQDNVLVDRVLLENCDAGPVTSTEACLRIESADGIVLQNSVLRDTEWKGRSVQDPGNDPRDQHCIEFAGASEDVIIVNNEIYNCAGDGAVINNGATVSGLIVEDNDFYVDSSMYCQDGSPDPNGNKAASENALDFKGGGTVSKPVDIVHNRMWGFQQTSTNCGASGSSGEAINLNEDQDGRNADYVLIRENVIEDAPRAVSCPNGSPDRISIWSNLIYNNSGVGDKTGYMLDLQRCHDVEVYWNTLATVTDYWVRVGGSDQDFRCNVILNGNNKTGTVGSGTAADKNAFYSTTQWTTGSGDFCDGGTGCATADANNTSYAYYRKRWTAPTTQSTIPNARATSATSPHWPQAGCEADAWSNNSSIGYN